MIKMLEGHCTDDEWRNLIDELVETHPNNDIVRKHRQLCIGLQSVLSTQRRSTPLCKIIGPTRVMHIDNRGPRIHVSGDVRAIHTA
jgi:hypothetical protein